MFKRILIPVTLPRAPAASKALDIAADLARESDAELIVGTVLPEWITVRDADWDSAAECEFTRRAEHGLHEIVAALPYERCETLVQWGSIPGATHELIEAARADLLVMAAKRPRFRDLVRTPDTLRIAKRSRCSVLLVRE